MFLCSAFSEGILEFAVAVKGRSAPAPLREKRDPSRRIVPPLDNVTSCKHILACHGNFGKKL
jgi:hypothetical protein